MVYKCSITQDAINESTTLTSRTNDDVTNNTNRRTNVPRFLLRVVLVQMFRQPCAQVGEDMSKWLRRRRRSDLAVVLLNFDRLLVSGLVFLSEERVRGPKAASWWRSQLRLLAGLKVLDVVFLFGGPDN